MHKLLLALVVLLFVSGCNSNEDVQVRTNPNDSTDKIVGYRGSNEKMNNAIREAQESFPKFLDALKNPCDSCTGYIAKLKFQEGDAIEHMWIDSLHFRNGKLFGNLASVPEAITRVVLGDLIEVKKDSLSDWLYVQKGKLIGGYTVKVIYDDMSPEEKRQLENDFQAKIRE